MSKDRGRWRATLAKATEPNDGILEYRLGALWMLFAGGGLRSRTVISAAQRIVLA